MSSKIKQKVVLISNDEVKSGDWSQYYNKRYAEVKFISVQGKPGPFRFTYTVKISKNRIIKWFSENSREGGEYKIKTSPEKELANIYESCIKSDGLNFIESICDKTNIDLNEVKSEIYKRYSDEIKKIKNQVNRMNTILKNKITKLENETI